MSRSAARLIPVRYVFPEAEARAEGWGRFLELSAAQARLLTHFRLERGDRIRVSFELPGELFERAPAEVRRAWRDEDGYFVAELRLRDEVVKARLGRALRDILARAEA